MCLMPRRKGNSKWEAVAFICSCGMWWPLSHSAAIYSGLRPSFLLTQFFWARPWSSYWGMVWTGGLLRSQRNTMNQKCDFGSSWKYHREPGERNHFSRCLESGRERWAGARSAEQAWMASVLTPWDWDPGGKGRGELWGKYTTARQWLIFPWALHVSCTTAARV